jgi:2-keto-4-pentenoate hydratase/2-oxohepta-3-ene-1,7-dioic acid hydratase in catechol pathway
MRIASLEVGGSERAYVRVDDGGFAPVSALGLGLPDDTQGIIEAGLSTELIARIVEAARRVPDEQIVPEADARFAPPYRRPPKIWGIGLNYKDHAEDLGAPFPSEPASFMKGDHTIIGPGDAIRLPDQSRRVTSEAELGLIVGRFAWQVDEHEALEFVGAVCCILDQTAEDILERNPRFLTRSKNFPTFFSFGPEIVTLDDVRRESSGLDHVRVGTWRNGELHRENLVQNMMFGPEELIAFHSRMMPLYPGDIISTGTPGAVVIGDGDQVECRIDAVGILRNTVRTGTVEPAPTPHDGNRVSLSANGGDDGRA